MYVHAWMDGWLTGCLPVCNMYVICWCVVTYIQYVHTYVHTYMQLSLPEFDENVPWFRPISVRVDRIGDWGNRVF